MATTVKVRLVVWHPHSERPVYEPDGDNRLILCLNMQRMRIGAMDGMNITYDQLNPDGSVNSCADLWHNKKWLKKAAIQWENLCSDTWWTYARDIVPFGI